MKLESEPVRRAEFQEVECSKHTPQKFTPYQHYGKHTQNALHPIRNMNSTSLCPKA